MRVAEYDRYGRADVLVVREREIPVPGPREVLVRVRAAALNPKDVLVRAGKFPLFAGRAFPKGTGYDFAGEVVATGNAAGDIREGAAVFGMKNGFAADTCAEYVTVKTSELALKPSVLSFEEAAALPLASLTALQALRDHGRVSPGDRVLVNGASGGVGVHAVQIAKALGARVITATSAANEPFVRGFGADETLDYAKADVERLATPVDTYFDAFGNRRFDRVRGSLTARGTYVTTIPSPVAVAAHLATALAARRSRLVVVRSNREDLEVLSRFVAEGKLRAVIAETFALDEIARAHVALESRRTRGKLVIRIA